MSAIAIRPLNPTIGAEIHGVDLARDLDPPTCQAIRRAMLDHLVVVFPAQNIAPDRQLAFARHFGEVEPPHPVFARVPEVPEVTVIEQNGGSSDSIYNDVWHTDVTFRARPAMASILHAQSVPAGGDTLWSSLYAAYEALSPAIRAMIGELSAIHDYYMAFGETVLAGRGGIRKLAEDIQALPPVRHPVVRTHPETGRKALFVNRVFTKSIVGLSPIESDHLLRLLCEFAEHPNYQLRHRWRPGDLAMWDNRCTMHLATSNFSGYRKMHRITLLGDEPRR